MGFLRDKNPVADINATILGDLRGDPNLVTRQVSSGFGQPANGGNVLARLAEAPAAQAQQLPQPEMPQPRSRRKASTLDILGGIADALAEFGGAAPGYREGVERRDAREMQMRNQDWTEKFNAQKLQMGQNELADARFSRFGQAARGLGVIMERSGVEGVAKAFPAIAQQMGMSPEEQQIFAAGLRDDPEGTLEALQMATDPSLKGSQPKEITIYKMLQRQDPTGKAAEAYMNRVASGVTEMTPYQEAQIALGEKRIQASTSNNRTTNATKIRVAGMRPATGAGKTGKGGEAKIDPATLDLALGVTSELRGLYDGLKRGGAAVEPGQSTADNIKARVRSSGIGQLIEGALGTEAQTARDKIAGIRPNLIRRIAEATGMTAAQMNSDKDMQLLLDQVTDPTRSYSSNIAAIDRLETLIKSRAGRGGASAGGSSPRPRIKLRPKNTPAAGKVMRYNPKTGVIE